MSIDRDGTIKLRGRERSLERERRIFDTREIEGTERLIIIAFDTERELVNTDRIGSEISSFERDKLRGILRFRRMETI